MFETELAEIETKRKDAKKRLRDIRKWADAKEAHLAAAAREQTLLIIQNLQTGIIKYVEAEALVEAMISKLAREISIIRKKFAARRAPLARGLRQLELAKSCIGLRAEFIELLSKGKIL